MALNVSVGDIPSGPTSLVSLWICCLMPATRISKNSSRLLLKMVMNLTRSISGWVGSCASSRTRRLNSSQLSSRLMKLAGSEKSRSGWIASGRSASSSVVTSAAAVCIDVSALPKIYLTSAAHLRKRRDLRLGGDLLVPDVFGRNRVNGVLGNVGSMIADSLEVTRDKH